MLDGNSARLTITWATSLTRRRVSPSTSVRSCNHMWSVFGRLLGKRGEASAGNAVQLCGAIHRDGEQLGTHGSATASIVGGHSCRCARLRAATTSTTARSHGWDRHGTLLALRAAPVEDELYAFTSGGVIVPSPNRCDRAMRLVVSNGKHYRKTDDA
jgi:hypothetical protein